MFSDEDKTEPHDSESSMNSAVEDKSEQPRGLIQSSEIALTVLRQFTMLQTDHHHSKPENPDSRLVKDLEQIETLRLLDSMFDYERIQTPYWTWRHLIFVAYFPLGLVVLLLRLMLIFVLFGTLPWVLSSRSFCQVLRLTLPWITGTWIHCRDDDAKQRTSSFEEKEGSLFVANHVSEFDALAIRWALDRDAQMVGYAPYRTLSWWYKFSRGKLSSAIWFLPQSERQSMSRNVSRRSSSHSTKHLRERITSLSKPLFYFPESGCSNGKVGVLKYQPFMFAVEKTVHPIALRASQSLLPINLTKETSDRRSTFQANFLWYLFCPYRVYTLQFLPSMQIQPEETSQDFADRVMKATSDALLLKATSFQYSDLLQYLELKNLVYDLLDTKGKQKLETLLHPNTFHTTMRRKLSAKVSVSGITVSSKKINSKRVSPTH